MCILQVKQLIILVKYVFTLIEIHATPDFIKKSSKTYHNNGNRDLF